jgi:hypothetical protein
MPTQDSHGYFGLVQSPFSNGHLDEWQRLMVSARSIIPSLSSISATPKVRIRRIVDRGKVAVGQRYHLCRVAHVGPSPQHMDCSDSANGLAMNSTQALKLQARRHAELYGSVV